MKRTLLCALVCFAGILSIVGCDENNEVNRVEAERQRIAQQEMIKQVPAPRITNWREKKVAARFYELRDRADLVMYVYTQDMNGRMHFRGKCLGFPIPYSTQYNAPHSGSGDWQVDQAEPNGLFPPASSEGTIIEKIGADGKTSIAYIEDRIHVYQHPLSPEEMN